MGVSLLSYELSQYFSTSSNIEKTETPTLLKVQKILYYLTQIMSFLINPIIIEFKKVTEQEEQRIQKEKSRRHHDFELEHEPETIPSICSRLKMALFNQLKYYFILFIVITIALCVVVILKIDILSYKDYIDYLPALSNIYGLILFSVTIGVGLSQIPLSIWRKSNPVNSIRSHLIQMSEEGIKEKSHFNYLITKTKIEYIQVKKLVIHNDKKEKFRKILIRLLSIFSVLIGLGYLSIEISYSVGYSGLGYFLNIVNNEILNQIFLFVFIGFVTFVGGHILSCLNPGSVVNGCCGCSNCRSCLVKSFDILRYKFEPKNTESSTFGFWSTYLQRLVPTIAYHCQQMVGANNSSLEQIMGKLDQFHIYTIVVKSVLPLLLLFVSVIAMCCGDSGLEREKIRKGLDVFKESCTDDAVIDMDDDDNYRIDQFIADDSNLTEEESEMYRKREKKGNKGKNKRKNDLEEPLNRELNSFHQPTPEVPNINDIENIYDIINDN